MKSVILAGGLGTRLSEETVLRPKPMVEIGGRPILWHIMKIYSYYGINDFIICCGYKGNMIKEYFYNYALSTADFTVDLTTNNIEYHNMVSEPWRITVVDTGEHTMTGGRLLAVKDYLKDEEAFCFTYGDGVSDVDIGALIEHHKTQGKSATVTAVEPPGRYGALKTVGSDVVDFTEKPSNGDGWINGGFFVLSPKVFDLLKDPSTIWELEPLETLARQNQLSAYFHSGFWLPMDTLRDKNHLQGLWESGNAPWMKW